MVELTVVPMVAWKVERKVEWKAVKLVDEMAENWVEKSVVETAALLVV